MATNWTLQVTRPPYVAEFPLRKSLSLRALRGYPINDFADLQRLSFPSASLSLKKAVFTFFSICKQPKQLLFGSLFCIIQKFVAFFYFPLPSPSLQNNLIALPGNLEAPPSKFDLAHVRLSGQQEYNLKNHKIKNFLNMAQYEGRNFFMPIFMQILEIKGIKIIIFCSILIL